MLTGHRKLLEMHFSEANKMSAPIEGNTGGYMLLKCKTGRRFKGFVLM
jgi:hypothetical protein